MLPKPGDGFGDRFVVRPRAIAELAFGFCRREKHMILGEPQSGRGDKRLAPAEVGDRLGTVGDRENEPPWQPQSRRGAADPAGGFAEPGPPPGAPPPPHITLPPPAPP